LAGEKGKLTIGAMVLKLGPQRPTNLVRRKKSKTSLEPLPKEA
jgi:hypothetical protein